MKKIINESKVILICTIIVLTMLTLFNILNFITRKEPDVKYYVMVTSDSLPYIETTDTLSTIDTELNERDILQSKMLDFADKRVTTGDIEYIYNQAVIMEDKYEIPKELILSIISVESHFYSKAHNKSSNATGLMQICKPALDDYNMRNNTKLKLSDMYDIETNMEVGTWTLRQQMVYLKDDNLRDVIISYNTGVGDFKRYKEYWYNGINIKTNTEYQYYEKVKNNLESFITLSLSSGDLIAQNNLKDTSDELTRYLNY